MMKNPRHTNETNAITLDYDDGCSIYVEETGTTSELWQRAISGEFGPVAPYTPPPEPTPEEILAAERAAMICTPAQMRLVLHRMDLLAQVQAIADGDPEASIVWEYATQIVRTSPLIEALATNFTPEQIDDTFRAAMALDT